MGHLEDLDEYEAERELDIRREYEAVFSLFRYCVLSADGTYLCNKLDVEQIEVEGRPYFNLVLEDVWIGTSTGRAGCCSESRSTLQPIRRLRRSRAKPESRS